VEEGAGSDGGKETHMLGAGDYPITIAEMNNYAADADEYFDPEEHDRLRNFLALNPERGRVLANTSGVRVLQWPIKHRSDTKPARVVYYFRDLNMPLYLLALYKKGERIPLSSHWRAKIRGLVDELVAQHREEWRTIMISQMTGGKELA
jgi:hypothetical protein